MKKLFTILCLIALSAQVSFAQWTEQTSPVTVTLYSVSASDNNTAWACGAGGKVIRTTDAGSTWTTPANTGIPTTLALYNIFGIDANNALVTGSGSAAFVYKTTDGGVTWAQVFTQSGGFIDGIWMTSALTGFMYGDPVGGRWSLWKTINGGTTWDSTGMYLAQASTEAGLNNSFFVSGTSIWFGTDGTKIYYSPTSGLTGSWVPQNTTSATILSIWFNTATQGLSGTQTQVMTTSNAGTLWTNAAGAMGSGSVSGIGGVGTNYWYCRGTNIYKSTNAGTTFTSDYTQAGTYAHLTIARTGTRLWAVKTNGGISKSDGTVGITNLNGEVPSSYTLSQNYPNPFNPTTNIEFAVPVNSLVKLTVYDALGKEVSTLVNEVKTAGIYRADFNASNLHSGIYFYTLEGNGFKETRKMMLIK